MKTSRTNPIAEITMVIESLYLLTIHSFC